MKAELGEMGRDTIRRRENCGAGSEVVGGRDYGGAASSTGSADEDAGGGPEYGHK